MIDNLFFYDLNQNQLLDYFQSIGEPAYRANQLWVAAYTNFVTNPDEITTLPKSIREQLKRDMTFSRLNIESQLKSSDGETIKTLFALPDGASIESVIMHYDERHTLCISSQAGCAMGCVFCATGQMGFKRNLSSGEIVEQVIHLARNLALVGSKVTNIVIMGMGEPFHNYDAVITAIHRLNDAKGMNLGQRRFTISTVGIVPAIRKFSEAKSQVNLAISLHAANDPLRSSLLPVNRKYPLETLMAACRDYVANTNRRLTFEWALIRDVNDSPTHAQELATLIKGMLCHVNLIPLNPTADYGGQATSLERAREFKQVLDQIGIPCTIRLRRGIDIQAGCGQLAARRG